MVKEKGIYNRLAKESIKSMRHIMRQISFNREPENKEEKILLPFLLQWLKERKDCENINDEFEEAYKKNWFPLSLKGLRKVQPVLITEALNKAIMLVETKKLYKSKESLFADNEACGYEKMSKILLFLFYCLYFYNEDLLSEKEIEYKIIRIIRIIKILVKEERIYKTYREITEYLPIESKKALYMNIHKNRNDTIWWSVFNLQSDIFPPEEMVLQYTKWKLEKETTSKLLDRNLFYSLCIRLPEQVIPKKWLFASLIYYWYYGIVEGNYAETIFNGLHGVYGNVNQNILIRLFNADDVDVEILNYFREKYKYYCDKKEIPSSQKFKLLIDTIKSEPINDKKGNTLQSYQLNKPQNLSIKQLEYLSKLLCNKGFFEEKYQNNFSNLIKGLSLPQGELIAWNYKRHSLIYLVRQLYPKTKKLGNGTWQVIANNFEVKCGSQQRQLPYSTSYSNLSEKDMLKGMEKERKEEIDECISKAKSANI